LTILYALARGATPLMYLATLAYCAVALSRNVLSAAVVAVYWLFVLLWSDFLARIFDFSLTQNWPTYALLGLSAAMGTVAIRRWLDREPWTSRWAPLLPTTALLLLLSGVLDAVWRVAESHDKPLRQDPFALQMAGQHLDGSPRVPGFWLPDQHSGMFRTASVNGRVLVIGFWSPHVPTSVLMLEQLRRVSQEFPKEQVTCIAVCVANDHAISPHVARAEAYDFPLVTDPGTHYAGRMTECSPVVEAFTVSDVPTIFITDRARRLVERIESTGPQAVEHLRVVVTRALTIPVPPLL
ncbi:MAG: peroxiredoxin family protein, partial [Candidatus Zipacnadales bacterium]